MAKQEATLAPNQGPPNLIDQLTTILAHPEFENFVNQHLVTPVEPGAKKNLSPDEQKIIDSFLEDYRKRQMEIKPSDKPVDTRSAGDRMFDTVKEYAPKVGDVLNTAFGNPFTHTKAIPDSFLHKQQGTKADEFPEIPEPGESQETASISPEDSETLPELKDRSGEYQKIIDELTNGAQNLNSGIDIASDAADETQKQLFNSYSKVVPVEPVTPLRVLGDLVKVGAAFAIGRNPGLALALTGAGNAIKSYDPAYRDYAQRKSFANALFEGMTATSLKELDAKLQEGPEKRRLGTQVKLAGIEGERTKEIAKYHETAEDIRSRTAGERQLQIAGIKTGRQSLLDQVAGLTNDAAYVKLELNKINDDDTYDELTQRQKVTIALQNVINRQHPKENFNSSAVKKAGDELYKMLAAEIKTKK